VVFYNMLQCISVKYRPELKLTSIPQGTVKSNLQDDFLLRFNFVG